MLGANQINDTYLLKEPHKQTKSNTDVFPHLMLLSSSVWRSALQELQSSILVPSLLLASCCDLWVLEEQLAIRVSASFRIRSDLVRLEWALNICQVKSRKD